MSDKPVLVYFWASCRAACEMMTQVLQEIAAEQDSLIIAKISVVENGVARDRYNIRQAMTLIVYQRGQIVKTISAFPTTADVEKLRSWLESQLELHLMS
jgi:thioredoxin 1